MINRKQENNKYHLLTDRCDKNSIELIDLYFNQLKVPVRNSREIIWNKISTQLENRKSKKTPILLNFTYQLTAAAVVLLIVGSVLFNFYLNKSIVYTTQKGHIAEIVLPDLSEVTLNAGTRLEYRKNIWNGSREVFLDGEAIFNVKKGKKFVVNTPSGFVEVLGTSFNVYSRNEKLKVSCFTGKVLVETNKDNAVYLTKGLETQLNERKVLEDPYPFEKEKVSAWRKGEFHFENTDFLDVIHELELQFNVQINYTESSKRYYTGSFFKNDLDEALTLICTPMNFSYKINNKEVKIF